MPKFGTYISYCAGLFISISALYSIARPATHIYSPLALQVQGDSVALDSLTQDTVKSYRPSFEPVYNVKDRFGDPFSNTTSPSPLFLKDPSSLTLNVEIDTGMNYTIYEKIGDLNYRPTTSMSFDEFDQYQEKEMIKDYWKNRSKALDGESAVSGRNLLPKLYFSPVFDRIFGGSFLELQKNGFVTLDFGGRWTRIENPSIPVKQQRNGGFEFDQQISMNVVGKIGEKLAITANFDNNNSFDFENDLKVEYSGYPEDIIKKLEIGNVSLPLRNSLISGAQNLFGVKTQLQFGKVFVTGVASTQRGKSESLIVEGGFQGREFEVRASNYDENRHFFLGHFFRDNYEAWLRGIPNPLSGINITRIEVYLINRNNDTRTLRNFVAFQDLGEGSNDIIFDPGTMGSNLPSSSVPTNNAANDLWGRLLADPDLRNVDKVNSELEMEPFNLNNGTDFVRVTSARRLEPETEFNFDPKLGTISMLRKLQNDEVLAVAFEYTWNGQRFKVGELNEDYANRSEDEVLFLKMLRPAKINTRVPTWDLMMKNIYNLHASQITREGFQLRVIYRDDRTGIDNPSLHEGQNLKNVPLIEIMSLDRLNPSGDRQPDGNFDFVEGLTIDTRNGTIFFPVLEPFGAHLRQFFIPGEEELVRRYVYDTLYRTTRADVELIAELNKYWISGKFLAGSSNEIVLPGINIAENSVRVTAGNTPLTEGVDFTVNYNFGKVRILNESVINSGKEIIVSYEKADLFNFQNRTLLGARVDYVVNDDINIGATLLRLNEQPLVSRVSIGDEPTRNIKYGLDFNYRKDSRFLTRMIDALPLLNTKEMSNVAFSGEFAQLVPGTSNKVDGTSTSYIDDFEATVTPFGLMGNVAATWKLASTPANSGFNLDRTGATAPNKLGLGYQRSNMSWYIVDNIFYRSNSNITPDNINDEDLQNHYQRPVSPQEIFRQRDREVVNTNETVFDLAYFPSERGAYNYNPTFNQDGPEANWAGITRPITFDVDFDKTNIEFIEFWMMDPFIDSPRGRVIDGIENSINRTGGFMVFNLGSVSEDVLNDERHAFENGLPADGDTTKALKTDWGYVTRQQYLNAAFDNSTSARPNQDVGWDGLRSEDEGSFFFDDDYLSVAPPELRIDPSSDDFDYYLGGEHDAEDRKIVERYKQFNGLENNSPVLTDNTLPYTPSSSNIPDNEDLNVDNTISNLEEYYEYKIDLRPGQLEIGKQHIVDKLVHSDGETTWYLFRIPVREPDRAIGSINGFKSIRNIRTYLTGWRQPAVLRLVKFQLVGTQWRVFQNTDKLQEEGFDEVIEDEDVEFTISVVNIEENSVGGPDKVPYVLPPGINRDRDNISTIERRQNEQSMQLTVTDLPEKAGRAGFKNVSLDMLNYGRIKMFISAQPLSLDDEVQDQEVTAFLRLGTDFTENYYEVEVPLTITPLGTGPENAEAIWPSENEIDIALDELLALKSRRDRLAQPITIRFEGEIRQYKVYVRGRPDLSVVKSLMIGMRNPSGVDEQDAKSFRIWVNELRVTDFDKTKGWASNLRFSSKLADFGTISASTRIVTVGFGGIQSKISERTRWESRLYDISTNLNLDKLLPEKIGLKIPMFFSYERDNATPEWDPYDQDTPLSATLEGFELEEDRQRYADIVEDQTTRKSLNFTNIRKVKTKEGAKQHIYDIENLSFTYAFTEERTSNHTTESYLNRSYRLALAYNYNPQEKSLEPFKNVNFLNSNWLKLIKDINLNFVPSSLGFRWDLDRRFIRTQFWNDNLTTAGIDPNFEKYFFFNRSYNLRWNITKSIAFDYEARANAIVDEPRGDIDTQAKRDSIKTNLKNLGRMKNFDQTMSLTYRLPLDKIPLTDWIRSDIRYGVGYNWTAEAITSSSFAVKDSLKFGNIITNNRELSLVSKVDLVSLYNKSKFLKGINSPPRRSRRPAAASSDTTQSQTPDFKGLKGILRLLMSFRNFDFNYTSREGTTLPGYNKGAFLFGLDSAFDAPGWGFILGSQNPNIRREAAQKDWLITNQRLTTPFSQTANENLSFKAQIEPVRDLKIQIDAKKNKSSTFQEIFRFDDRSLETDTIDNINGFVSLTPSRIGQYSISYPVIKTAFISDDLDNNSPVFQNFEDYREIIARRLTAASGLEYSLNSQDVLITAFQAAYSDRDPETIEINPFPRTPLPNWRVDYSGLSRIKVLSEVFSSISITHAYQSSYDVSNYSSSLLYNEQFLEINNDIEDYPLLPAPSSENDQIVPIYIVGQVGIRETFAPLIGLSIRTKSRVTARAEFKKERAILLNLNNAQVTEQRSSDFSFEFGLTKNNFKVPFRIQGRTVRLKNDLTFRFNFTLRNSKTVQRKIAEINTVTSGNFNIQFRPTLSYVLNQRLNIQVYFERNVNEPRVSNSFKRSNTGFGTQVRFSLSD